LQYGLRVLLKNPGFTIAAVAALALGIGANTAIFSAVNCILLRPLPYPDPDRIVMLWENHQSKGGPEREWASPSEFRDWRDQGQNFENVCALAGWNPTITGDFDPAIVPGALVSHDFFTMLGAEPVHGRSFRPEEEKAGAEPVVVIGYGLWQRQFGADPDIVGKAISLSGNLCTVVGIMPAGFEPPLINNAEIWRTLEPVLPDSCGYGCLVLRVMARVKPGRTIVQARSEMSTIARRLEEDHPGGQRGVGVTVVTLQEQLVGDLRPVLLVLVVAVGFVLLIACANVANLLLARSAAREREIALRTALGASRSRLMRQLLTESLLLASIGGVAGLLIAYWMVRALVVFGPEDTPRLTTVAVDGTALLFTLAATLVTGLLFGLAPSGQSLGSDLNQALKEGNRESRRPARGILRSALVVLEVALSLVLLIIAGLLMKSFMLLQGVDPGFDPRRMLTINIRLPNASYGQPHRIVAFYSELLTRIKNTAGVREAGAVSSLPLGGSNTDLSFAIEGRSKPPPNQEPVAWYSSVTTGYFLATGMRFLRGRPFSDADDSTASRVVIINERMARRYWPDEDPIGRRIGFGGPVDVTGISADWRRIVGIVADVKHFGLDADARPSMYFPDRQRPTRVMNLVVRTAGDPLRLVPAVRAEVASLDPHLAIANIASMESILAGSIGLRRFTLFLTGLLAVVALSLAAIGVYGVISYSVAQRTHEIGIRMALGAHAGNVLSMILKWGLGMMGFGMALGYGAALLVTPLISSLLFGVTSTDPQTFVLIGLLLTLIALLACYLPARRATKVDPLVSLRSN